ncbi:MAG: M48 family metalloprotease [Candidatus Heimdallarchaeota archaeon]|nr:M48 family metalloprotease [Candidatus Heimdallarchaeota archaeon]
MYLASLMDILRSWFSTENLPKTIGFIIAIICGIFILTELYTVITQKNEPDLIMLMLGGVIGGLIQGFLSDPLLAILAALCWFMIFSLWTIRESPVWRELMLASLISYFVILGGRIIQVVLTTWAEYKGYDPTTYTRWGLTGQQWFGIGWNVFIYVFFIMCIIFFGRRFFLVSRLTSPQIIYLLLFALSYFVLYRFAGEDGLNYYFSGVKQELADRLLFASFGTYEIMIVTNLLLYFISGPLLQLIFGVKSIDRDHLPRLVKRIHRTLIRTKKSKESIQIIENIEEEMTIKTDYEKFLPLIDELLNNLSINDDKHLIKIINKAKQCVLEKKQHERVLALVEEVREKLGIISKIKVGKVKAPILNAFAYGAFFDKRIAFMSKDLESFSDDDIRGIAGHELVHSKKVHTLWLLIITAVTFAVTKALNLPATPLDYIFDPDVGLEFLLYYLYNIALVGVSYIFVRFMEGRADKLTMQAGYGVPLAKSLIKLDGFYQGIASEMGMSVYLLTDKEQTHSEKVRFLGDSGRNMYNNYIKPNISENFINLIASHPKAAYRVAALTEQEKLRPFKAALLPFFLLVPYLRKPFINDLQEMRKRVATVIDKTFNEKYPDTGIKDYDKLTHLSYQLKYLEGKDIVAISKMMKRDFIIGSVEKIVLTNSITSPINLIVKTSDGKKDISYSDYEISEMGVGQKQIFKNGKIGTITELCPTENSFVFKVKFMENGIEEIKELKIPGMPISYFESIIGKDLLLAQKGVTRLAHLDEIIFDDNDFGKSKATLTVGKQTKEIDIEKFIISFKPFDIYLKKGKESQQKNLLESLKGKPASFQTKDDLDTLTKGKVTNVTENSLNLLTLDEERAIEIKRIEFLYIYEDTIMLIYKPSLSFIERIIMAFQNRKKLTYIIP